MFREARPDDLPALLRLYRQLHPADPDPTGGPEVFQQILRSPGLHLFVLEVDDSVVATTYLNVIPNLTRGAAPPARLTSPGVSASATSTPGRRTSPHPRRTSSLRRPW